MSVAQGGSGHRRIMPRSGGSRRHLPHTVPADGKLFLAIGVLSSGHIKATSSTLSLNVDVYEISSIYQCIESE